MKPFVFRRVAEEAAVPESRKEEGADGEAARRAGGVHLPQETKARRAGRTQLGLSGLAGGPGGDQEGGCRHLHTGSLFCMLL